MYLSTIKDRIINFRYFTEATPCEDELTALRQGRVWDPVLAAREKEERLQRQREEEEESKRKKKSEFVPKSNYQEKYSHLVMN